MIRRDLLERQAEMRDRYKSKLLVQRARKPVAASVTDDIDQPLIQTRSTTRAEESRIEALLLGMADKLARRIDRLALNNSDRYIQNHLEEVIRRVVHSRTIALIRAAKVPPSIAKEVEKIKVERKEARRQLASELKSARAALQKVRDDLRRNTALFQASMNAHLARAKYPMIPEPMVEANEEGSGLPATSGVYFVWSAGIVVYVGQSVKIAARARCPGHGAIEAGDSLSWLEVPPADLNWVESFYIGICRPLRNFGGLRKLNHGRGLQISAGEA